MASVQNYRVRSDTSGCEFEITLHGMSSFPLSAAAEVEIAELIGAIKRAAAERFSRTGEDLTKWGASYVPENGQSFVCCGANTLVRGERVDLIQEDAEKLDPLKNVSQVLQRIYSKIVPQAETSAKPSAPDREGEAPVYEGGVPAVPERQGEPSIYEVDEEEEIPPLVSDEGLPAASAPPASGGPSTSGLPSAPSLRREMAAAIPAALCIHERQESLHKGVGNLFAVFNSASEAARPKGTFLEALRWQDLLSERWLKYRDKGPVGPEENKRIARAAFEVLLKDPESKEENAQLVKSWLLAIARETKEKWPYGFFEEWLIMSLVDENCKADSLIQYLKQNV